MLVTRASLDRCTDPNDHLTPSRCQGEGGLSPRAKSGRQCTAASRRFDRVVMQGRCASVRSGSDEEVGSGSSGATSGVGAIGGRGGNRCAGRCDAVGAVGAQAHPDHHRRVAGAARATPAGPHWPLPGLLRVAAPAPLALRCVGHCAPSPHRRWLGTARTAREEFQSLLPTTPSAGGPASARGGGCRADRGAQGHRAQPRWQSLHPSSLIHWPAPEFHDPPAVRAAA